MFGKKKEVMNVNVVNDNEDKGDDFSDMFAQKDEIGSVEAIRELNNPKNIQLKTEFNIKVGEPHYFAKLQTLGFLLNWTDLSGGDSSYVQNMMLNKVSGDRKGRKESVQVLQTGQQEEKQGMLRRMFS